MRLVDEAEFYREDRGRSGGEVDYGCFWAGPDGTPGWRVTLIERTGEVYCVGGRSPRYGLLGTFGRAIPDYRTEADPVFAGWAEACHAHRAVEWFARRLHGHGYRDREHAARAWVRRAGGRRPYGLGWLRFGRVLERTRRIRPVGGRYRVVDATPLPAGPLDARLYR